jgi:predicted metal-dependent HD superfamily phosphohydrolase
MELKQSLEPVKDFVEAYFETYHKRELTYHNLNHTKSVVEAATRIAENYLLNEADLFAVISAAWFHDTGYLTSKEDHESRSAELAGEFLTGLKMDNELIQKVTECIKATRMPQKPKNLLQEILCDADLFHLGSFDFADKSKRLRKELEAVGHVKIDKRQWRQKSIELLENLKYFTDYAQLLLNDRKETNFLRLRDKQIDDNSKEGPDLTPAKKNGLGAREKKSKDERPEKGIETMFRITSGNNQKLSDMADGKAHILITVNSIILSAIISLVLKKLSEDNFLAIPSFILLTVSLLTMIFAIMVTRPTIPKGVFRQEEIDNKTVNLLFFGNFYKMSLEAYKAGMIRVMNDEEFLYGTLINDVYCQGAVLGKKYRLLRVAYSIFMFGLIIAVLAFIISSVRNGRALSVLPK